MMESDPPEYADDVGIVGDCCSLPSWRLSMKRKFNRMEDETLQTLVGVPSFHVLAHVEIENECSALRAALARQQMAIDELQSDLDEERNASSSAANEAMSMILRLQREKAEIKMDTTQFKRIAEETMRHGQHEILTLEEIYFKCDQAMEALSFEVDFYKNRLLSYGFHLDYEHHQRHATMEEEELVVTSELDGSNVHTTMVNKSVAKAVAETSVSCSAATTNIINNSHDGFNTPVYDYPTYDYPPLRCVDMDIHFNEESIDSDKYTESDASFLTTKDFRKQTEEEFYPVNTVVGDDLDFRDSLRDRARSITAYDGYLSTPRCPVTRGDHGWIDDRSDLENVYKRLQEVEADREMLKNDIISMRTDNTQLVLLQEIAQNLCMRAADEEIEDCC